MESFVKRHEAENNTHAAADALPFSPITPNYQSVYFAHAAAHRGACYIQMKGVFFNLCIQEH
jgi:hypothetical protein